MYVNVCVNMRIYIITLYITNNMINAPWSSYMQHMGYGHLSNTSIPYDGDINPCSNGLMTIPPFHPISGCSPSWMAIAGCEKIALSQNKVPMYHNNAAWKMLIVYLIIFPIYFPYFGVSTYFGHPWWVVSLKGLWIINSPPAMMGNPKSGCWSCTPFIILQ